MKNNQFLKFIPNITTMANATIGIIVILISTNEYSLSYVHITSFLILLAGVLDFFDGYLARSFDAVTPLGKELDSFSDIISFGIAPMMIFNSLEVFPDDFLFLKGFFIVFYIVCGIIRLARYNIGDFNKYFVGLPITAAGCFLALYFLISYYFNYFKKANYIFITIVLVVFLSLAMVSNFKVKRILK